MLSFVCMSVCLSVSVCEREVRGAGKNLCNLVRRDQIVANSRVNTFIYISIWLYVRLPRYLCCYCCCSKPSFENKNVPSWRRGGGARVKCILFCLANGM